MTSALLAYVTLMTCMTIWTSEAKTVVFIPLPFTSHTKYHTNAARALAKLGHQVWLTMPTYLSEKGYLDTSGFSVIPYDTVPDVERLGVATLPGQYFKGERDDIFGFLQLCMDIVDLSLRNETFASTIRQTRPDLVVIDNLPMYYTMAVLPYRLGVPFAFLGSAYYPPLMRVPFSPADTPMTLLPYSNKMTFSQRLTNTLMYLLFQLYNPSVPTDAVATYAPSMPYLSLHELISRAEVWLVELDHVLDYPKPVLPNVKLIGGAAAGPAKPLPPGALKSFMDSATEGVVLVSFGSYVLSLPPDLSDKVMHVLQQLPMKSVFRTNLTSPDPDKILTSQWLPQNDLLGHPNTKVFVSHCGKNGQYEALYHAVPVVATPLFGDQPYNAERARTRGFAEVLDLKACTADQLLSTILSVAREGRYKQAAAKLSGLFRQQYGLPMERAAFWLDHVMEHGGDYMRSAGQEMPFYQYALLDVALCIVLVLALSVGLLYVAVRSLFRCARKRLGKTKAE